MTLLDIYIWFMLGFVSVLVLQGLYSRWSLRREAKEVLEQKKEIVDKQTREVAYDTSRAFHEFVRSSSKFATLQDLGKLEIPTMEEILDLVFINLTINGYKPVEEKKEKPDEVKTV